jgi:multicomponent K+:H+ antiporter subunit E
VTAVLAAVVSLTPGSVSADYDADAHALLVHGLDVGDPAAEAARIKARYERALREVFSC